MSIQRTATIAATLLVAAALGALATFSSPFATLRAGLSAGLAQSSDNFDLAWHVIAGGGGQSESGAYTLGATMGQPAVGGLSDSGYRLEAGFWPGISVESPTPTVTGTPPPTATGSPQPTSTATPTRTPRPPGYTIYVPIVLR